MTKKKTGAKMGRPAKPTVLRMLTTDTKRYKARFVNRIEIKPPVSVLPCPDDMPPAGREEWERVVKTLIDLELLTDWDWALFRSYCYAVANYRAAQAMVSKEGVVIEDPSTGKIIENPAIKVMAREREYIRAACSDFGFSPSSRAKMAISGVREGKKDSFDDYLQENSE